MKAVAVFPRQRDSAHMVEVPELEPSPGQVLVQGLETGICGTDLEINSGAYGEAPPGQGFLILGHESLGRVLKAGRSVQGLEPGDLVVPTVRRPDHCLNCQRGQIDMCLQGNYTERGIKGAHGFLAERYVEDTAFLIKIPPALREVAVLLEPLSVGEKAVAQATKIQQRMYWQPELALVLGAGPIGMLAALLLHAQGIPTVAYARTPEGSPRLQALKQAGIRYISSFQVGLEELPHHVGSIRLIIEATGSSAVAFQALGILATNGVMCLASVTGGDTRTEVPTDRLNLQMVLGNQVVFGSVNSSRQDFLQGIQDMQTMEGRWPGLLSSLITRRLPLERFRAALQRQPEDIKVAVTV